MRSWGGKLRKERPPEASVNPHYLHKFKFSKADLRASGRLVAFGRIIRESVSLRPRSCCEVPISFLRCSRFPIRRPRHAKFFRDAIMFVNASISFSL